MNAADYCRQLAELFSADVERFIRDLLIDGIESPELRALIEAHAQQSERPYETVLALVAAKFAKADNDLKAGFAPPRMASDDPAYGAAIAVPTDQMKENAAHEARNLNQSESTLDVRVFHYGENEHGDFERLPALLDSCERQANDHLRDAGLVAEYDELFTGADGVLIAPALDMSGAARGAMAYTFTNGAWRSVELFPCAGYGSQFGDAPGPLAFVADVPSALAIHEATGLTTVNCFGLANVVTVAKLYREKTTRTFLYATDELTAQKAIQAASGVAVPPTSQHTYFEVFAQEGKHAVEAAFASWVGERSRGAPTPQTSTH